MVWPGRGPRQGKSRGLCDPGPGVKLSGPEFHSIHLPGAEGIRSTPRPRRPVLPGAWQLHFYALTLGHGLRWGPCRPHGSPGRPIPVVKPAH